MKIPASGIQARNIGQIATVALNGDTTMGKIERVKFTAAGLVCLRVSGETMQLNADHEVDIRRSVELGEAYKLRQDIGDVLDEVCDLEPVGAAA